MADTPKIDTGRLFAGADNNDLWLVKGPNGGPADFRFGQEVKHGDLVRFEHEETRDELALPCEVPISADRGTEGHLLRR